MTRVSLISTLGLTLLLAPICSAASPVHVHTPASLFAVEDVSLLPSPFTEAVSANRAYLLALEPDRLLAPFLREAGLEPKAPSYGNWESGGLDGHTAGHYLSALAFMIAAGDDPDGELNRRLDYMLAELARCQQAAGDGYIGGVPGSRAFWAQIAEGKIDQIWKKWVPWYNVHKTYAGLRDAYLVAHKPLARELFVGLGDWCVQVTGKLSDAQMQDMLRNEYGGMNEVLADLYALTGETKYLQAAERFTHRAVVDPLIAQEDKLTGLHANTQIPKIIGLERLASLENKADYHAGARFFWETVTQRRSIAFGGNSVSEHFNDPAHFHGMLEHREGPETCNTYNMLRLTEDLFAAEPQARYADYYERALFNHLLSAINPETPGYVYFTPIRPGHYRVYSQPETSFWCCVGTGMENPGRYGEFIYARAEDGGVYVNLFIPSTVKVSDALSLKQETKFPYEEATRLTVSATSPTATTIRVRHPEWVPAGKLVVKVNGKRIKSSSTPSSYVELNRTWRDGDNIEVALPMSTRVERLPDGSDWVALMHGPILLAAPRGTEHLEGLRADGSRMGHVAHGPTIPLQDSPVLLSTPEALPKSVVPDKKAGPLHFRLKNVVEPAAKEGLPLVPFFALHDARYQIYWHLTTKEGLAAEAERLAAEERTKAVREAATVDRVAVGEQQPEVEHDFVGENAETGIYEGRRWRHGTMLQYTLNARGEKALDLELTYSGADNGRTFDIFANGTLIGTETLKGGRIGSFFPVRYAIPADVLQAATEGRIVIRIVAKGTLAGGLYDLRLLKPEAK